MTEPRQPASFRIQPEEPPKRGPEPAERAPRAIRPSDVAVVTPAAIDVFDTDGLDALAPPQPPEAPRRSRIGMIFFGAAGLLVSLAVGLWTESLIRELFSRNDWLGWLGAGLAGTAFVALVIILVREFYGLARLASVAALQVKAAEAHKRDDAKAARDAVADLVLLVGKKPETAAGRRAIVELKSEIIDGGDFIRYAEAEILAPLDEKAKVMIMDAAKRVSVVTAVSPRALVDVAYVLWEAARMVRAMSELYGGRPGTLGFFRLARSVLAHLAVTGTMAAGDSLVQQLVGHGLAARLSAKLGEGVINGLMTVRIGLAAMETARPFPFIAVKRPGLGDFATSLASFATKKRAPEDTPAP